MSVAEISQLHGRFVRISDHFKTLWTYHQFATGVFKNFLNQDLPYEIDFQRVYEPIRGLSDLIQRNASEAMHVMTGMESKLASITATLLSADDSVGASVIRRFFEKLRQQDDRIIFYLIKFYLYADSVDGEQRDKVDFLFTRIAEDFIEDRGEYSSKDSLELRKQFQSLLQVRPVSFTDGDDAVTAIRKIRDIKQAVDSATTFEELSSSGGLADFRRLKHDLGDHFFHPDVLLAIVQCNIAVKNRFSRFYATEESRILEDATRLLANERTIARGLGGTNPDLLFEIERFKQFKQEFDDSRAESNVKHDTIGRLKSSMATILTQLDHDLSEPADTSSSLIGDAQRRQRVQRTLGDDPALEPWFIRIGEAIDHPEDVDTPGLRFEPWESEAWELLVRREEEMPSDTRSLLVLYLRAAALRAKIDDEASAVAKGVREGRPVPEVLDRVRDSLDRAKQFDATFREALQGGVWTDPKILHRLYRSRLRLLRGFSGLWLIYDQYSSAQ